MKHRDGTGEPRGKLGSWLRLAGAVLGLYALWTAAVVAVAIILSLCMIAR